MEQLKKGARNFASEEFEKEFGIITIEFSHRNDNNIYWKCTCECGNIKYYHSGQLWPRKPQSCGCMRPYGQHFHSWTGCGDLSGEYFSKIRLNAKRREIEFNVTKEYLWDKFQKQDGLCAYTNVKLTLPKRKRDLYNSCCTASLDRIDSLKGYVEGNVQWVLKDINVMKQSYSEEHFIKLCKLVANKCNSEVL